MEDKRKMDNKLIKTVLFILMVFFTDIARGKFEEAEKKIEILTKNADGELEAQPFGDEAEGDDAPPKKKTKKKAARKKTPKQ